MKKRLILLAAAALALILTFYALYDATQHPEYAADTLEGRIRQTEQVSIGYGVSSYAFFSQRPEVIAALADCFAGLTFAPTEESIDFGTTLMLNFAKDGQDGSFVKIWLDRYGVFYFDDDAQSYYRVESGDFDFEDVYTIYRSKSDV